MASRLVTMRLRKVSRRLVALREELRIIDEQALHLADDASDAALRAIVSDAPHERSQAREADGHAAAMARHRAHVVAEIARLERAQDELLDRLGGGS